MLGQSSNHLVDRDQQGNEQKPNENSIWYSVGDDVVGMLRSQNSG